MHTLHIFIIVKNCFTINERSAYSFITEIYRLQSFVFQLQNVMES